MATPLLGRVPCAGIGEHSTDRLLETLDEAGTARFYEKAAQFQHQLQQQDAGQCLFCGIMTALGYARNQAPFRELAARVPLTAVEAVLQNETEVEKSLVGLQALLMGTAGFLPSQRPECEYSPFEDYAYVKKLETVWERMQRINVMEFYSWQSFRIRPANSPLRRIAGMCLLLHRYQVKGLLNGLLDLFRNIPAEAGCHLLEDGLISADDGYWASRFDFGKGYPGLSKWLIGQSRAADIVINVLLPFVYTWGRESKQTELAEKAFGLYRSFPPVEKNTVEQHMRGQFGLKSTHVKSAQRKQGLLHLYKKWCTQGRCRECEVVKK